MPTTPAGPRRTELISRGIVLHHGAALLCQNIARGYFYLPGGHVDPGESAAEALAREFWEEAGLRVNVGKCIAVTEEVFTQDGTPRRELNLVFHVELPTSLPMIDSHPRVVSLEPAIALKWLTDPELAAADLKPANLKRLVIREAAGKGRDGCADLAGFSKVLWASHLP